jgi:hypothetical protein|tara:strand:- start:304 stop:489 length:186 start_codon:yes stop_codon:yes gene_type:complete
MNQAIPTKVYSILLNGEFMTTIREISEFCAINKFKAMWNYPENGKITATIIPHIRDYMESL